MHTQALLSHSGRQIFLDFIILDFLSFRLFCMQCTLSWGRSSTCAPTAVVEGSEVIVTLSLNYSYVRTYSYCAPAGHAAYCKLALTVSSSGTGW